MYKEFNETEKNVTMDVFLKDGKTYLGCDVPEQAISKHYVSFWQDEKVVFVPREDVKCAILNNGE